MQVTSYHLVTAQLILRAQNTSIFLPTIAVYLSTSALYELRSGRATVAGWLDTWSCTTGNTITDLVCDLKLRIVSFVEALNV